MSSPVVVIGGGLSGLSAAHTVLQGGGSVVLIDKNPFLGGNSTKATSGLNGAGTAAQKAAGIPDTKEIFEEDTVRSGEGIKKGPCPPSYALARVLTHNSASAVEWVSEHFNLTLDKVSRLGGHSHPRTHRSGTGGKFPGMQITYALMQALDDIEKAGGPAKVITRAKATALLKDGSGAINGVTYVVAGNTYTQPASAVVIATGGYGAGVLDENSLLKRVRPDLMHLPTTNGKHCTGDGIDLAVDVGGGCVGLKDVQVHPTGLVNPEDPHNKTKFLAAGALRGEGGVLLDRNGKRFCNELGTRDYVSGMMFKNQAPFRLVLGSKSVSNIAWHCKHYKGRGVMKSYSSAHDLAKDMGVDSSVIASEFKKYNAIAAGETECPWEKPASFCKGVPLAMDDEYHVAIVTPIVHYTMGGLDIDAKARVKNQVDGAPVKGLYAAGEAAGGVHRLNRLGGSALLECVVFGRVAGSAILGYLNGEDDVASSGAGVTICVPQANGTSITIKVGSGGKVAGVAAPAAPAAAAAAPVATAPPAQETKAVAADANKTYTLEEVAKHNTESDVWVIVNGDVLDVTQFMHDHPGGKMAIMTFAGKDASEEFNMLHEKDVVAKYAPECIVGKLKPGSKL